MFSRQFIHERFDLSARLADTIAAMPRSARPHVIGATVFWKLGGEVSLSHAHDKDLSAHPAEMVLLANAHGKASDLDHCNFYMQFLEDARLTVHGTSVAQSFSDQARPAMKRSGFHPAHFCMNYPLSNHAVAQIVFRGESFEPPLTARQMETCLSRMEQAILTTEIHKNTHRFSLERAGEFQNFRAAPPKESYFMYVDISGSARIMEMSGVPNAYGFIDLFRARMQDIVAPYGGQLVRGEGDGGMIAFPATSLNAKEQTGYLRRILQAADDIKKDYRELKTPPQGESAGSARLSLSDTFLRIGITRCAVKKDPLDGPPYYRLAALKYPEMPRNHDIVLLDAEMQETETLKGQCPQLLRCKAKSKGGRGMSFHVYTDTPSP